jgi:asparagine synthase (glutamine-hydrolysing)
MWHSVESRTPFADDIELINKIFSIAGIYKIKNGQLKHLLRESVKKYLPKKIYERTDKMGYLTPHNTWLRNNHQYIDQIDFTGIKQFLNFKQFQKNSDYLFKPVGDSEQFLAFKLLTLSRWKNIFKV